MTDQRISHRDAPLVHKLHSSNQQWAYFPNVKPFYPNGTKSTGLGMNDPYDMTSPFTHLTDFVDFGKSFFYGVAPSELLSKKCKSAAYKTDYDDRLVGRPGWLEQKF